jgi:hypothetical protein
MTALAGVGADPEADKVVNALKEHFALIHSIRVKASITPIESGGLQAEDPEKDRPIYSKRPEHQYADYEVWLSPPKYRKYWTENGKPSPRAYFDGKTFTAIDTKGRKTFTSTDGSRIGPIRPNVTHAIGYCFLDTLYTPLSGVLEGCGSLRVTRAGTDGGHDLWLIEAQSLPDTVLPRDWSEKSRKSTVIRIWVRLDPEVVIRRWAIYLPREKRSEELERALKSLKLREAETPIFKLDGYDLHHGFVNCDFRPVKDELRKRNVLMPGRMLEGGLFGCAEHTIHEIAINPVEAPDTFRPAVPNGYSVTVQGEEGSKRQTQGGSTGEKIKIKEISQQARETLSSGKSLRAETPYFPWWGLPAIGMALILISAISGYVVWKRRDSRCVH